MMARENIQTGGDSTLNPFEMMNKNVFWGGLASKNIEAMALAVQGTIEHSVAVGEANMSLGLDRARKAQDLVKSCLNTGEAQQLVRIAADFQRSMIEDYIGHAQKVLGMTLDRAHATTNAFEERAQTALDEARKAA